MTVHIVTVPLPRDDAALASGLLSELASPAAQAVALVEVDEARGLWRAEGYYESPPDMAALEAALLAAGLPPDLLRAEPLPRVDWVARSLQGLAPVRAGRFFVHGSHDRGRCPPGLLPIEIDAATAFGTGHHGTTRGCLLAMADLARRWRPRHVLDIGTGTGILAIAAARLWRVPVIASDIDAGTLPVARACARRAGVAPFIRFLHAPGARHELIRRRRSPWPVHALPLRPGRAMRPGHDLILANILAGPLRRLAPELCALLAPRGHVVLSGLLVAQEAMVLSAWRTRGLVLAGRFRLDGWSTLVLRRSG